MEESDPLLVEYHALHPTRFPIVERLELRQQLSLGGAPPSLELYLEMCSESGDQSGRLLFRFSGVTGLRLSHQYSLLQLPLLEIRSIKERQWEGLNYKVRGSDEQILSFYCRDFVATLDGDPYGGQ